MTTDQPRPLYTRQHLPTAVQLFAQAFWQHAWVLLTHSQQAMRRGHAWAICVCAACMLGVASHGRSTGRLASGQYGLGEGSAGNVAYGILAPTVVVAELLVSLEADAGRVVLCRGGEPRHLGRSRRASPAEASQAEGESERADADGGAQQKQYGEIAIWSGRGGKAM